MDMDSPTLLGITDKSGLAVPYTDALWSDMADITLDITTVNSDNENGSEWTSLDTAEQIFEGAILCLMIALTMLGNSLVVLAVCLEKKLRTFENFFFASLAIADLSIAMLVLPLSVRVELSGGRWDLGPQVCDLFIFTDVACCTASILHLCTIGINRCRSITSPLHYVRKQTFRRAAVMIVLVWIASFLIACPPLIGWPHSRNRSAQLCEYDIDKLYVVYSSCGSFFIPLLVMVIVYTRIYQVSRRGAEFRRNSAPQLHDHHHHNQPKGNNQSIYQTRNHYDQVHSCPPSRRRTDLYRLENSSRCLARVNSTAAASAEAAFQGYPKATEAHVTKPVLRRIKTSIFTFHPPGRCEKRRFTEVKTVKTLGKSSSYLYYYSKHFLLTLACHFLQLAPNKCT
nr:5-hydroxytryptamine receptor 1A-like [Lytechinus pictus]